VTHLKPDGENADKGTVVAPSRRSDDELEELAADINFLIAEESDVMHRLGGHPTPAEGCVSCAGSSRPTASRTVVGMTPEEIADLVHLRRTRDLMDRDYARPLDVPAMARAALMSPAHFSRKFRAAYGETPYSYLMTRRIERAKALLRQGMSVTDTCVAVGCTSLGSFSSRFTEIVGETPSQYRARDHRDLEVVPPCVSMVATRPRRTAVTA
jgi:AraC-like DNA-binding protein